MVHSEERLTRAQSSSDNEHAVPPADEGAAAATAAAQPPAPRPRRLTLPPPDPAEALYYEGLAAYQHRNWEEALARFTRLKELQPTRPGLDALLDEVRWFLQLQAAAPNDGPRPVAIAAAERISPPGTMVAQRRTTWRTVGIAVLGAIGIIALLLLALQGRLPWSDNAAREAQDLFNRGQARLAAGDYEGAYAAFEKLLELVPDDPEAQLGLKRAERQQLLAQMYAVAEAAIAEEDWERAAAELAKIMEIDSRFADVQTKAALVAQRRRLAELYSDGSHLYDLGRWEEAIARFEKLRELDISYRADAVTEFLFTSYLAAGRELIDQANGQSAEVKRAIEYFSNALALRPRSRPATDARRLGGLYFDALRASEEGNLGEAQMRLEVLLAEDPTYAGGQAAKLLYTVLLTQGAAALQAGDIVNAVRFYRAAQNVAVSDHSAALQGEQRALSATPTPMPSPTPTLTLTPSPTPPAINAAVRAGTVNLRGGPGAVYPVLRRLSVTDRLSLTGRSADGAWVQVCVNRPADAAACPAGQLGWVAASLVEIQGTLDALPLVAPPPTPTVPPTPRAVVTPTPVSRVGCVQVRVLDVRGGAPLAGWLVALEGPDGQTRRARTGVDGTYRFTDLLPGTYLVSETLQPSWRAVSPENAAADVRAALDCTTVDFWNERIESSGGPAPTPPR